ncbi:hypothetical protein [Alicyclobacillus shizuokensis]|uniref:hypothetical protein n=1 Tax=Alicyclobacillus shizuokensis TaxID=392014 RepID=UPI0008368D64|nr:hypothetical protein [Alicyclobacillus shizuokensis]
MIEAQPLTPDEIQEAFCLCGTCWDLQKLRTIEMLARELEAAHHVLELRGTTIEVTNPALKAWIEWARQEREKLKEENR